MNRRRFAAQDARFLVDMKEKRSGARAQRSRREPVAPATVAIAAARAFVQARRNMLIDDSDDTARASSAFGFAAHMPENRANARPIRSRAEAIANFMVR
jgi:hypothetical protein